MIAGFLKANSAVMLIAALLLPAYLHMSFEHQRLAMGNIVPIPWADKPDAATEFNMRSTDDSASETAINDILKSPVFSHTRLPFVPELVQQQVPATEEISPVSQPNNLDHGSIRLLGVLLTDGNQKALLAWPESPEGNWLATNEVFGDWRIVAIEDNRVVLSAGGSVVEVQQYVDKPEDDLAAPDNNQ